MFFFIQLFSISAFCFKNECSGGFRFKIGKRRCYTGDCKIVEAKQRFTQPFPGKNMENKCVCFEFVQMVNFRVNFCLAPISTSGTLQALRLFR